MTIIIELQDKLANKVNIFSKQWTMIDILQGQTILMAWGLFKIIITSKFHISSGKYCKCHGRYYLKHANYSIKLTWWVKLAKINGLEKTVQCSALSTTGCYGYFETVYKCSDIRIKYRNSCKFSKIVTID